MKIPRYSLRTSMLLVAAVALVLAALVALRSRALARQKAIEAVDRLNGSYGIRITGPTWYRELMGRAGVTEKAFYDPLRVSLGPANAGRAPGSPIRDGDIEALADRLALFTNLEVLDLSACRQVTDRGVSALPVFPKLKHIRLSDIGVSDDGVKELRRRYPGVEISR